MKHISESIIGRKLSDIPLNKETLSDGDIINIGYNPATDRESYFVFLSPEVWKKYSHDTFHKVGVTGMIIAPDPQLFDGYYFNNFDDWDDDLRSKHSQDYDVIEVYKSSKKDLNILKSILNTKDHRDKGGLLQNYIDNIVTSTRPIKR